MKIQQLHSMVVHLYDALKAISYGVSVLCLVITVYQVEDAAAQH